MTDTVYTIDGRDFYQEPLVLGQIQWLKKRLAPYNILSLTQESVVNLVIDEGPALLAIVLIPRGQTRAAKVQDGLKGVAALEEWLQQHAQPEEVMEIASHFFQLNHAALNRSFSKMDAMSSMVTSGNGSTIPSCTSPMETSPK